MPAARFAFVRRGFFAQKQALKKGTVFPDSTFLLKIKMLLRINPSVSKSDVLSPLNLAE